MKTGYRVCDAMTRSPINVDPKTSIEECAKIMKNNHVGALLIKDGNFLKGLLTEQDIVRNIIAEGLDPKKEKAGNVMVSSLKTIAPEKDIYDALVMMRDLNIRHLPVMNGNKMVGLLTIKDILKIEPQLFEMIVEKFELREESRKPIFGEGEEGECESCGKHSKNLNDVQGTLLCSECIIKD